MIWSQRIIIDDSRESLVADPYICKVTLRFHQFAIHFLATNCYYRQAWQLLTKVTLPTGILFSDLQNKNKILLCPYLGRKSVFRERDFAIKDRQWAIACWSLDYTVSQHYHINISVALQGKNMACRFTSKDIMNHVRVKKP